MPKTRRHQNSIDSNNESINENNIANNIDQVNDSSTASNSAEQDTSSQEISPSIECHWVLGQLAWARVGNFPFWPCIVTLDPISMIYHKLRGRYISFFFLLWLKSQEKDHSSCDLKKDSHFFSDIVAIVNIVQCNSNVMMYI